jgi:tetratricopeptide (TPR) repeat protein
LTKPPVKNILDAMSEYAKKHLVVIAYFVLIAGTMLVFLQVRNFDFINYDDPSYVYENQRVLNGLTSDSIAWAFTAVRSSNWHPLTWLSLMFDCHLFGPDPGLIHLVNLFLHLVNTLLLFSVLKKMTGSLWPSAFVAAAFALHPMHVESVAWIAERKDVLSTLFLLLTLSAYASYVRRGGTGRYLLAMLLFALGLMAKPMLVTLPFLLLLADYWPLNRFDPQTVKASGRRHRKAAHSHDNRTILYRIIIEKVPFLVLAVVSSVITFIVQRGGGGMAKIDVLPFGDRVANAFLSYARYIGKMFLPEDLAVFYPFDAGATHSWQVAVCVLLLLVVTILVIRFGRDRKYLPFGWFWFVGTLVPVIGLVQVGKQAIADRYTYIPYIGLFIMMAWGLPELLSKLRYRRIFLSVSAAVALTALGICTYKQTSYWSNSTVLFSRAIEVTQDNDVAYNNRGSAYCKLGRWQEAASDFGQVIRIKPDYAKAYNNLGAAYGQLGRRQEAMDSYMQAIKLNPDFAEARYNLAGELAAKGRYEEAVEQYRTVMKLKPNWPDCMNNLALLIATRPGIKGCEAREAVNLAVGGCKLQNNRNPAYLGTLAAAYASAGRFNEAVSTAKKAMELADAANQPQVRDMIRYHLSFYAQGKPYVEPLRRQ